MPARKREKTKNREISGDRSHDIFFGFTIWLRSHTVVNKVPFGTSEPYGDRARRREGFEPHDLRVIASRPSSSRVVLRARQAALPKLALWKTPLAKTPCPWRFDFANPTSHARRSHNPKALCQNFNLQIKKARDTLRCLLFSLYRAAEKDISRKSL